MCGRLAAGLILLAVFLAASTAGAQDGNPRRPKPPPWTDETESWRTGAAVESETGPAADERVDSLILQSTSDPSARYVYGTAFAVASNGLWLTARQHVDNCRSIFVEGGGNTTGFSRLLVIEIDVHPNADVAVLRTAGARLDITPVPIAPEREDAAESILVGFPQGRPAAIFSRVIGPTKLRRIGTQLESDAIAWVEISRVPGFDGDLGGLAGGLVMSPDSRAIGTVSGESQRRGRILTTTPSAIWDVVRRQKTPIQPAGRGGGVRITPQTYPPSARNLIQERRVSRLVCETKRGLTAGQSRRIR